MQDAEKDELPRRLRTPEEVEREREFLYGIFVQTISANESRRQQLSLGFAAMGAALATAAAAIEDINPLVLAATLLIIAFVWLRSLQYYQRLAWAKFQVIEKLEAGFHFRPFLEEWTAFHGNTKERSAKQNSRTGLSDIEMLVPRMIMLGGLLYFGWAGWNALMAAP